MMPELLPYPPTLLLIPGSYYLVLVPCSADIPKTIICLTKTTAAQNEDALSYHSVRGLHILAIAFVTNQHQVDYSAQCS